VEEMFVEEEDYQNEIKLRPIMALLAKELLMLMMMRIRMMKRMVVKRM